RCRPAVDSAGRDFLDNQKWQDSQYRIAPMTAGGFGDQYFAAYNRRARSAVYWEADAALCDTVPSDRSDRRLARPARDPLGRARLYRRPLARLALLPRPRRPAAAPGRPPGRRRFPGVGHARGRSRRPPRLCPVLYAGLLRGAPAGGALCLAWRDVV